MTKIETDGPSQDAIGAREITGAWLLVLILFLAMVSGSLVRAISDPGPALGTEHGAPRAGSTRAPADRTRRRPLPPATMRGVREIDVRAPFSLPPGV